MQPLSFELTGERALITGASRGIGAAIAITLAQAGATVLGTATSAAGADAITAQLAPFGGQGLVLDVTDNAQIDALPATLKPWGVPTILVNNAGITRDNLVMRMKDDDWDAVIAANLTGVFRVTKAVLRDMLKQKRGAIINVGSVVGTIGNAGQTNYAAAKAGLLGFTKSLAREVASRGITVNAIAPGFIETDMTARLEPEQQQTLLRQVPLGRMGSVWEVAALVQFLASPAARYLTGETLHINGGLAMA